MIEQVKFQHYLFALFTTLLGLREGDNILTGGLGGSALWGGSGGR